MLVLANIKKIYIEDLESLKFIDGLSITDLVDISCSSDGENHMIFLLDGSGKIVVVIPGASEDGVIVYVLIVIILIIAGVIIKYIWFKPKQTTTDLDDASRQDRDNAYR